MKVDSSIRGSLSLFILLGTLLFQGFQAHAIKVEAGVDYPFVFGTMAQNFNSNIGGTASFYLDPVLDPKINNFVSVGYSSFTVIGDQRTSFRVFPILVGLELPGRIFTDLQATVAFAAGGALAYLSIPNAASTKLNGYFSAQIKPGILWEISPDFAIYGRTPITFLIGSKTFNTLEFSAGAQIKI